MIDNTKYKVSFIMNYASKKLEMVLLRPEVQDNPDNILAVRRLKRLLIEKYGKPSVQKEDTKFKSTGLLSFHTEWFLPSTIIQLDYIQMNSSNKYAILLKYKKRLTERTKNL